MRWRVERCAQLCVMRARRRPNDVRIDCKAAKHSDGDRGAVLAHLEAELREPRRRSSADCASRPLGLRANKRRFVNLLQQLARATRKERFDSTDNLLSGERCENRT